jgi:hypothetical protein
VFDVLPSTPKVGELLNFFCCKFLRLGTGEEEGESSHGSAFGFINRHTPNKLVLRLKILNFSYVPVCFNTGVPDSKKLSPCQIASKICFFHFTLSPIVIR